MKKMKVFWMIVFVFSFSAFMKFGLNSSKIKKTIDDSVTDKVIQLKTEDPTFEKETPTTESLAPVPKSVLNFRNTLDNILRSLPTRIEVHKQAQFNLHGTPELIYRAAAKIGQVTDLMIESPELRTTALRFFSECASQNEGIPAIRAVCLSRARELNQELGLAELHLTVPAEVEELAHL